MRDDFGKLILRVAVGSLLLFHGVWKVQNGIDFVREMVSAAGLPAVVAYGVYAGEIIAPILLILGALTRPAALLVAADLVGAIGMARREDIMKIGSGGAWAIEAEAFFVLGALAIAFLGAGRLALGKPSTWN